MKELLKAHVPTVTTIEKMNEAIQYYVEQLQWYVEATMDAKPWLLAGLGGMKYRLGQGEPRVEEQIRKIYQTVQVG